MKKYSKIICVLLLIMTVFIMIGEVYAAVCPTCNGTGEHPTAKGFPCVTCGGSKYITSPSHSTGDVISGADSFIQIGESGANDKINEDDLQSLSNTLYNMLLVIGIVVAIIVGLIMGIKFIMGGLEEKAEIKAMIIPYIIGCVVVFGAFTIWQIVVNLLQSM